jgi:hypothetical protein
VAGFCDDGDGLKGRITLRCNARGHVLNRLRPRGDLRKKQVLREEHITRDLVTVGSDTCTWKVTALWVVAPYSLVEVYRRFRGVYCLHDQRPDGGGSKYL